jgi:hypothetical protein
VHHNRHRVRGEHPFSSSCFIALQQKTTPCHFSHGPPTHLLFGSATIYSVPDIGHTTVNAGLSCRLIAGQFLLKMRFSPAVIRSVLFRVSSGLNAAVDLCSIGAFHQYSHGTVAHIYIGRRVTLFYCSVLSTGFVVDFLFIIIPSQIYGFRLF